MNRYQEKRIIGCLKRPGKLTAWEIDFLTSLQDTPVVPFGDDDEHQLTEKQNAKLNDIAQRTGG